MATTRNVYQRLNAVRVELQKRNLKKSGRNTFAGYDYFELADFIPHINELFAQHGLFSQVSYTDELATLTILNVDKPEEAVTFTSPMSTAALKGCHEVQNLGAVQTYLRRYLYTTALEIVEHDALDSTMNPNEQPQQRPAERPAQRTQRTRATYAQRPAAATNGRQGWRPTQPQQKRIFAIASSAGVDEAGVKAVLLHVTGQDSTANIPTREQYDEVCALLEAGGIGDGPDYGTDADPGDYPWPEDVPYDEAH